MHISIYNPKGGVGKTTVAIQLAAALSMICQHVVLVDHDPQASALTFSALAQAAGHTLPFITTNAVPNGFEVYVHDFPSVLRMDFPGRLVVMPTLLDATSFIPYMRARHFLEDQGMEVIAVGNRYRPDRAEQKALAKRINGWLVNDRATIANAFGKGQSIFAMGGVRAASAQTEINRILASIDLPFRRLA